MMGSIASTFRGFCSRVPPRSAHSAISVPITVVPAAVSSARYSVFQATPQRVPPATQPSPQMRSVERRSTSEPGAHSPMSSYRPEVSERSTG
jgi:hypothetical protein